RVGLGVARADGAGDADGLLRLLLGLVEARQDHQRVAVAVQDLGRRRRLLAVEQREGLLIERQAGADVDVAGGHRQAGEVLGAAPGRRAVVEALDRLAAQPRAQRRVAEAQPAALRRAFEQVRPV